MSRISLVSSAVPELVLVALSQTLVRPATTLGKDFLRPPRLLDSIKSGAPSGRALRLSWILAPPVPSCSTITVSGLTSSERCSARRSTDLDKSLQPWQSLAQP